MKKSAWENSRHWPVSYRSQDEAGLPDGDLRDEVRGEHWFWFSALFILIVIAPAIVEWIV